MAEYFVGGQRFVVSPDLWADRIPRETILDLHNDLYALVEIEKCRDLGILTCNDRDWNDIVEVAKKVAFEILWRPFAASIGIHMEVR